MAKVIVDKDAILLDACIELVFAEADVKRIQKALRECRCDVTGTYERHDEDNCLTAHFDLGFKTAEQDANKVNLCSSCALAMTMIEDRIPAQKRLSTAKNTVLRLVRAKGKQALAA